jgi:hypothetical protein
MSWRVIAGLLFLYIVVVLLTGVLTEVYFGTNETTIIDYMLRPETPTYNNPVGGISATFATSAGFMSALFKALFLESPLFYGDYQIIRILILVVAISVIIYWVISGRQSM